MPSLESMASPGASIVGTCIDPYATNNPVHLAYHEANRASGRMGGQIRMRVRHRRLATGWADYLFLSPDELRAVVLGSRWDIAALEQSGAQYAVELRLRS